MNIIEQNFDPVAIEIGYSDYTTRYIPRSITWNELKTAPIDTEFKVFHIGGNKRSVNESSCKIEYKDENICVVSINHWGTTDDDNPTNWKIEPKICLYKFKH